MSQLPLCLSVFDIPSNSVPSLSIYNTVCRLLFNNGFLTVSFGLENKNSKLPKKTLLHYKSCFISTISSWYFHFVFYKSITKTNMREKLFFQSHGALITGALICFCSDYASGLPRADDVCVVSLLGFCVTKKPANKRKSTWKRPVKTHYRNQATKNMQLHSVSTCVHLFPTINLIFSF